MTTSSATAALHEELASARTEALTTLARLEAAKLQSERRMAQAGSADLLARVTGRSALDNAIAEARRIIETIDRHAATDRTPARTGAGPEGTHIRTLGARVGLPA
jgi:hypothetical protein